MYHLFQHASGKSKNKFDIAFIRKGRYGAGSNQGYNRKRDAIALIKSMGGKRFQDDTLNVVYEFAVDGGFFRAGKKPSKPYIPQSKK
jgi:hypothetical protein